MIKIIAVDDFDNKEVTIKMMQEWWKENASDLELEKGVPRWRTRVDASNACKVLMKRIDRQIRIDEFTEGMSDEEYDALMQAPHLTEQQYEALMNDPDITKEDWLAKMRVPAAFDATKPPVEEEEEKPARRLSSNSIGISLSWKNEEVKKARTTRHRVYVLHENQETEHKSTKAAFDYYGLPDSKHIRFRMRLKQNGFESITHDGGVYEFRLGAEGKGVNEK